jgi:hypothetical protein
MAGDDVTGERDPVDRRAVVLCATRERNAAKSGRPDRGMPRFGTPSPGLMAVLSHVRHDRR